MYWDVTSFIVYEGSGDQLLKVNRAIKDTEDNTIPQQTVEVALAAG